MNGLTAPKTPAYSHMMNAIAIYLSIVLAMSIVCIAAYGLDKRRASNGGWRVPEHTLQVLAFLGGWPGALWGQRHFRHKTRKLSFLIVFWLVVALHVGIVGTTAYVYIGSFRHDADSRFKPMNMR